MAKSENPLVKNTLKNKIRTVLVLLTCALPALQARSQNAANWNMNGSLTATTAADISASSITLGSASTTGAFNGGTEYYGEGGWPAGAMDPTVYFQFGLNAGSGYYLSVNTVTLVMRRSSTGIPAGSGPTQWSLRSSLDNFASDIGSGSMTDSYLTYAITLPANFQGIPSSVIFRLYGYTTTISSGGFSRLVFDNISVQGHAVSGVLAERSIDLDAVSTHPGSIALQWKVSGFAAGTDFKLERSVDGRDFEDIYGTQTTESNDYVCHYQDRALPSSSQIFYRVSAVEPGGQSSFSPVIAVKLSLQQGLQITGVIAQGTGSSVRAILQIPGAGECQVFIASSDGRILSRTTIGSAAGSLVTDIAFGGYPHGIYILTLANAGQRTSKQFIY